MRLWYNTASDWCSAKGLPLRGTRAPFPLYMFPTSLPDHWQIRLVVPWEIKLRIKVYSELSYFMAIFKIRTTGIAWATTNQSRLHLKNQYGHARTNCLEIISNYYSLTNNSKGPYHHFIWSWDLSAKSSLLDRKINALWKHGVSRGRKGICRMSYMWSLSSIAF